VWNSNHLPACYTDKHPTTCVHHTCGRDTVREEKMKKKHCNITGKILRLRYECSVVLNRWYQSNRRLTLSNCQSKSNQLPVDVWVNNQMCFEAAAGVVRGPASLQTAQTWVVASERNVVLRRGATDFHRSTQVLQSGMEVVAQIRRSKIEYNRLIDNNMDSFIKQQHWGQKHGLRKSRLSWLHVVTGCL